MKNKNRRILWLLNHKTLMSYEVPLLRSLGFEVFTPKIIPDDVSTFRSGSVDYTADSDLTVPKDVLNALNSFNFYSDPWRHDITFFVNTYFGSVFTMPLTYPFQEVVTKFKGQIVLRAFGLQDDFSYDKVLRLQMGDQVYSWLEAVKDRFWFGKGYEQLDECETPFFKNRSVFLPLGLNESYWKHKNTWRGTDKRILFVCPNINDNNYYYAQIYKNFKASFGDLPHVIVGQQKNPVNDPYVLGHVSDEELIDLYKDCALLYYHSQEPRHVHYSPIEAAIIGTPIVFYKQNLLGRLLQKDIAGATQGISEARITVERLLQGDHELIAKIRSEQEIIPYYFSNNYCEMIWRQNMLSGPLASALFSGDKPIQIMNTVHNSPPLHTSKLPFIPFHQEIRWFDSIKLANGRVMPGVAPYEVFKARADIIFAGLVPGETVLDIGDGDGFYAFESELRGAGKTTCIVNGDSYCFLYAKQELASRVEVMYLKQFETMRTSNLSYDWVVVRGILNQTRHPFHLLERLARIAKKRIVIESILDLQDLDRPAAVYYGGENRPGYPPDGFGFNFLYLKSALNNLGFQNVSYQPTPDAPTIRGIITAMK